MTTVGSPQGSTSLAPCYSTGRPGVPFHALQASPFWSDQQGLYGKLSRPPRLAQVGKRPREHSPQSSRTRLRPRGRHGVAVGSCLKAQMTDGAQERERVSLRES